MSADPQKRCPVAALAQELRTVWAAAHSADKRCVRLKEGSEYFRLRTEHEYLQDRAYTLEEAITQQRATSPEGLLMQIALAAEEADTLASYGSDKHGTRVEQHRRQILRLLHSAASAVEALHGLRREELFGKAYLLRTNDPLAPLDRVAGEDRA